MIPILYDNAERAFVTNGIGRLSDCISCKVTEERNGIYECEFEYPITGIRYNDIQEGCIIAVTHDDTGDIQPFDIYARTAPIDGIVTFYAHHVSYRLSDVVVAPCTASSPADALDKIRLNSINGNPFNFWTNKTGSGEFKVETPDYARALLGGQQGSVLDVYGKGDYEFDRWTVKLYLNRGTDSGVEIRYGKNLADLKHEIDISESYNAVVPYWVSSDGQVVMLPEKILIYSGATDRTANLTDEDWQIIRDENDEPIEITYQVIDARPLDLSSEFQEAPTVAQLRSLAQTKLTESEGWVPDENITVDFVQLWQTEEYKDYAPLQRVRLCDTVSVYYPELGVEAVKTKVIKTVYNVLLDRYDEMELGTPQTTLAQSITGNIDSKLENVPTNNSMIEAISQATELITGGLGGHVQLKRNANGNPEEILIMNNDDINQATKLWRWNLNGLGYSETGYSGTYGTAITMNGAIVADYITTGKLNANIIKAGVLSDVGGNTTFNLSSGLLTMTKGSINIGNGAFTVSQSGTLTASSATLNGSMTSISGTKYTRIRNGRFEVGYTDGETFTTHGFVDGSYTYSDSSKNLTLCSATGHVTIGASGKIFFTDGTLTGTSYLTVHAGSAQSDGWRVQARDLYVSGSFGVTNGVSVNPVYIPSRIGSGGVVSSYYTLKIVSGILMNA